ncbi:HAD family hydrolase [Roseimicrobium sp. ORNL1]|uniref:HAD family hydrolase n=1 Tax=Roseimicrobium sp. ORNL1 TaxID=2711231 RepID=UPI0013E12001|nr:HAD family hydrolase [Roseimicrobium sp. ORNL1]QIF02797.1 HAD family hydrolase [Roseimicrobium sp. ORNL1]
MIHAVLFDLDRTLLDRDQSFAAFASGQHERFAKRMPDFHQQAYVERLVALDALGSVWKDVVYQRLIAELGIDGITWEELFADFDTHVADSYVPFPKLQEVLAVLSQSYSLGIITNGKGEFQQRTIARLDIAHYFKTILISEIEGVRKPEAEIFHRAVSRLGCARQKPCTWETIRKRMCALPVLRDCAPSGNTTPPSPSLKRMASLTAWQSFLPC